MLSRRTPVASARLGQTLRCQPLLNSSRMTASAETNESAISGQRWASNQSPAISGTFCHKRASIVDDGRLFCVHFLSPQPTKHSASNLYICRAGPVPLKYAPREQDALQREAKRGKVYLIPINRSGARQDVLLDLL